MMTTIDRRATKRRALVEGPRSRVVMDSCLEWLLEAGGSLPYDLARLDPLYDFVCNQQVRFTHPTVDKTHIQRDKGRMNHSAFNSEQVPDDSRWDEPRPEEEEPAFGAVDIVEAFTAMRHEWRGQTKESRALAEQIEAAAASLRTLETKLLDRVAAIQADDPSESQQLVELITETDHQLARAVAAIGQWEANGKRRAASEAKAVETYFNQMNAIARWFARPLMTFIAQQQAGDEQREDNPAAEGLSLVLARLRRMMRERQIERLDTAGQPFDASTMNAIGTVETADCPSGYVAQELCPAYLWRGRLLRFADVRVAK